MELLRPMVAATSQREWQPLIEFSILLKQKTI